MLADAFDHQAIDHRNVYVLIGSMLSDPWLTRALDLAKRGGGSVHLWGCGWRGEAVAPSLVSQVQIHSVRGPRTRAALGLPQDTVMGDSAFLLPLLYQPPPTPSGRILVVPHILDPRRDALIRSPSLVGADHGLLTEFSSLHELVPMIDAIANASFVLAGAMHAAIIAAAYHVPFAFLDSGWIDLPEKWRDLAAALSIPSVFAQNVAEGLAACDGVKPILPDLAAMLACAPLPVLPQVLARARNYRQLVHSRADSPLGRGCTGVA